MADLQKRIKKAERRLQFLRLLEAIEELDEAKALAERYRVECATMQRERDEARRKHNATLTTFRQIKDETLFNIEDTTPLDAIEELTNKLGAIQRLAVRYLGESAVG